MIKKFNLFKESVTDIEQLKDDVKDSLLELSDQLDYKIIDTDPKLANVDSHSIEVYTSEEYKKDFKSDINMFINNLLDKSNIVIKLRPKYATVKTDKLEDLHEINEFRYKTTDLLINALDRFEGEKYFYEKEKWSWFIFLGK